MIKHRFKYLTGDEAIVGTIDQIAEYINRSKSWLKAQRSATNNPQKLEERNTLYDLVDWNTGKEITNVPYEELTSMWPIEDVRYYSRAFYEGHVNRNNKLQIVKVKEKPLEVQKVKSKVKTLVDKLLKDILYGDEVCDLREIAGDWGCDIGNCGKCHTLAIGLMKQRLKELQENDRTDEHI